MVHPPHLTLNLLYLPGSRLALPQSVPLVRGVLRITGIQQAPLGRAIVVRRIWDFDP